MIKSIIKKYLSYANKVSLEYDDLFQEASMALTINYVICKYGLDKCKHGPTIALTINYVICK